MIWSLQESDVSDEIIRILTPAILTRSISSVEIGRISSDFDIGPQTENRLQKLIRIWRALHEYVNFVHDPEKQYRSLSEWSAAGVDGKVRASARNRRHRLAPSQRRVGSYAATLGSSCDVGNGPKPIRAEHTRTRSVRYQAPQVLRSAVRRGAGP